MTIEPPQPPTAPAPATRPTPPTPPRIDMSPFRKSSDDNSADEAADDTPEAQARDAVANGSGPLTKRTVERDDDNQAQPPATRREVSSDAPLNDTQSDYDRGQDVLRQFRDLDARDSQSAQFPPAQTSTEQLQPVAPTNHQQGYGVVYWIFTIIFVAVATVIVAKKFLFTGKPALTKSQLSVNESTSAAPAKSATPPTPSKSATPTKSARVQSDNLKATVDKPKPVKPPPKPSTPSKDDDKGKHFEIRV